MSEKFFSNTKYIVDNTLDSKNMVSKRQLDTLNFSNKAQVIGEYSIIRKMNNTKEVAPIKLLKDCKSIETRLCDRELYNPFFEIYKKELFYDFFNPIGENTQRTNFSN